MKPSLSLQPDIRQVILVLVLQSDPLQTRDLMTQLDVESEEDRMCVCLLFMINSNLKFLFCVSNNHF